MKSTTKNILSVICFLSIFNIFYLTPVSIFSDLFLQLFSIYGVFLFFSKKLYLDKNIRLSFTVTLILISSSIISSYFNLHQDIFSGIIASQHIFKSFSVITIYYWVASNKIQINFVFKSLVRICWIYTIILSVASLTGYSFTFISPLSGKELIVTANKYSKDILFLVQFYYIVLYFSSSKLINLLKFSLIFISTQLYDIQRGDMIFLSLTLVFSLIIYRKKKSTLKFLALLPLFLVLVYIILGNNTEKSRLSEKFSQLTLVLDDEGKGKIEDASIFVRLNEIKIGLEGFFDHPISGNGLIRSSKQEELIGNVYFYPVDIGVYGVLYSFGIIGILIFIYIFLRIITLKNKLLNVLQNTFFIFAFFILIYTFKDGYIIYNPSQILLCFLLINILNFNNLKNNDSRLQ